MKDLFSLSISCPVELAVSGFSGGGAGGLGMLNAAVFCDINGLMHSTKNNDSNFGFQTSAGIVGHYGPMIKMDGYFPFQKIWLTPAFRSSLKYIYKGKRRYINFIYGYGTSATNNVNKYYTAIPHIAYQNIFLSLSFGFIIN